jgi:hypothetical protein
LTFLDRQSFELYGCSVKRNLSPELEAKLLAELANRAKSLKTANVLNLKCPCGKVILPPTPALSNLEDRQRGLVKSRIRRHLRDEHHLSDHIIDIVVSRAFSD